MSARVNTYQTVPGFFGHVRGDHKNEMFILPACPATQTFPWNKQQHSKYSHRSGGNEYTGLVHVKNNLM